MLEAPIPADEEQRLSLLKACRILYTPAEEAFDDVARLAADLCDAEIALITLVDSDYQWFKARVGVEQTGTSRDLSFCGHCINHRDALIVEDTLLDPRFADNPLVTGDPHIRFYAGVPLLVQEGSSVGALSVAGRAPRSITPRQLDALKRLAAQISRELRLRRDLEHRNSTVPPSAHSLSVGAVVGGHWRIVRELGQGRFGWVFEAEGAGDERAAIKVLQPQWRTNEEVVERFAREARVLMRLTSPHVGKLLDVGNFDAGHAELPYLVLEYLEGTDLERMIEARGRIPFREAFHWCAAACEGVAEAHDLGVVHRDLKPSNVFLAEGAGDPVPKVIDFGIAGEPSTTASVKLTAGLLGSPAYMSPEQMVGGEVGARSDIWSMGALLYEAATGRLPFDGATELQIFAAAMPRPPLPPRAHVKEGLSQGAETTILRCLRKQPGERYGSMRALADALRVAAAEG